MKSFVFIGLTLLLASCASEKPKFEKDQVCTHEALRYLRNPRNRDKRALRNPNIIQAVANSTASMQQCYEDFKDRTGLEEFNTCMVVGVDYSGNMEFYNFGSKEVELDQSFVNCANNVTKKIPYTTYGRNYILIQSYKFYVDDGR